jgi:hypothetical protein
VGVGIRRGVGVGGRGGTGVGGRGDGVLGRGGSTGRDSVGGRTNLGEPVLGTSRTGCVDTGVGVGLGLGVMSVP